MILHIAGVNHFDPAGRQSLVGWLAGCHEEFGKPAFIATEWDEKLFERVKAQRDDFQRLIRDQRPTISSPLLKSLTLSLAFEGDAYAEVFPDVPVLWLDQDRHVTEDVDDDVRNYASGRLAMYKSWLGNAIIQDDFSVLGEMRENAIKEEGCPPTQGGERDAKFAGLIMQEVAKKNGEWAAIIVGKFHALRYPGSMLSILEEHNHICTAEFL